MGIIARTEDLARKMKDESEAQALRECIKNLVESTQPLKHNLSLNERRALTSLKNKDIMILPADKGKATVIMKPEVYKGKMMNLLDSSDYTILKTNPRTVNQDCSHHC